MCDNIGEFKLCTCSDKIDKKKPYWKLEKFNSNKNEIQHVIIGTYTFYFFENIKFVLDQLNNNSPFDFDYTPNQKDMLTLNFKELSFNLIYTNGKWRDFSENYPGLKRDQKDFIDNGVIS
jgi:hypothetical protein